MKEERGKRGDKSKMKGGGLRDGGLRGVRVRGLRVSHLVSGWTWRTRC